MATLATRMRAGNDKEDGARTDENSDPCHRGLEALPRGAGVF